MLVIKLDDNEDDLYRKIKLLFSEKDDVTEVEKEVSFQRGELLFCPSSRIVRKNEVLLPLTKVEYDILYLLAMHPGQVFTREQIYEQVWNHEYIYDRGNITAHINKLRKKVEDDPGNPFYIQTIWGIGYKFNNDLK